MTARNSALFRLGASATLSRLIHAKDGLDRTSRLNDLWLFPGNHLVYNQIRKAGSSSTLVRLAETLHSQRFDDTGHSRYGYGLSKQLATEYTSQLSPTSAIVSGRRFSSWTWITVVRHPQVRLLSAFLSFRLIIDRPTFSPGANRMHRDVRQWPRGVQNPSEQDGWREFITFLEGGGLNQDPHWAPQASLLVLPVASMDYIIKLENFHSEFPQVISRATGHTISEPLRADHPAVSWGSTAAEQRASHFLRGDLLHRTEVLCRSDLTQLGYVPFGS